MTTTVLLLLCCKVLLCSVQYRVVLSCIVFSWLRLVDT